MATKFKTEHPFKKIELSEMADFIEQNYPEDKEWFVTIAYQDKDGNDTDRYNHLRAVRKFCEKYAPDLIPQKREKEPPATDRILAWRKK